MISIIVPIHNITEKFEQNLKLLRDELAVSFKNYEIIVSYNGRSMAREFEFLRQPQIIYISSPIIGKGHALKRGFEKSSGDPVVFIDADMELQPKDIKNFAALLDIYQADIVIGSKRHPYSQVNYPWHRKILSWCYQIFIRLALNIKGVRDSQVGLKLFRREVLNSVLPKILVKQYAFDLEVLAVASRLGYNKILEAPIRLDYHHNIFQTTNLQDFKKLLKMIWYLFIDTLAIIYRMRILKYYDKRSKSQETISK